MFYKDFYHREMWYLNTRKHTIFLHVKISIISLTSGFSLKLYLNSLVYHRNIFGSSSKVLGNLRTSSEILGKCSGTFVWSSGQFENLRKSSEGGRKSSENHQKRRHQYVYIRKRILHVSSKIWILCSRHRVIFSIYFFVLFFCLLLHRLAVRISLLCLIFLQVQIYCTDPGLQLGDPALLIGLLFWNLLTLRSHPTPGSNCSHPVFCSVRFWSIY